MTVKAAVTVKAKPILSGIDAMQMILDALRDAADYLSAVDSATALRNGKDPRRLMGNDDVESTISPLAQKVYDARNVAQGLMGTMRSAEGDVRFHH